MYRVQELWGILSTYSAAWRLCLANSLSAISNSNLVLALAHFQKKGRHLTPYPCSRLLQICWQQWLWKAFGKIASNAASKPFSQSEIKTYSPSTARGFALARCFKNHCHHFVHSLGTKAYASGRIWLLALIPPAINSYMRNFELVWVPSSPIKWWRNLKACCRPTSAQKKAWKWPSSLVSRW